MRRLALLSVVAALSAMGCGQSEEEKAEEVAVSYFEAIGDGNFEEACELTLEGPGGEGITCEEVLRSVSSEESFNFPEFNGNVDVDGDTAEVQVESEGRTYTAHLEREDEEWKVDDFDREAAF